MVGGIFCAFALSGCSYTYDLRAVKIGGRIAFIVDPRSQRSADCIRSIHVQTARNEKAMASAGADDDPGLVRNGVFWYKDYAVDDCLNAFPIFYGQKLKGEPFKYSEPTAKGVEAKPLKVGVIYEVETAGSGGYGGGRFRIREDGRVENLPRLDAQPSELATDEMSVADGN